MYFFFNKKGELEKEGEGDRERERKKGKGKLASSSSGLLNKFQRKLFYRKRSAALSLLFTICLLPGEIIKLMDVATCDCLWKFTGIKGTFIPTPTMAITFPNYSKAVT